MAKSMRAWMWGAALAWASAAAAQGNGNGGVYIDREGLLRARETANVKAPARNAAAPAGMAYVSLPRLIAAAKEANGTLPPEIATLGGMVRLTHVFVFPADHDLVLAGPAEELSFADPKRPLGKSTGRPALRLDDLATMLRTVGRGNPVGCSLDLPDDAMAKLQAAAGRMGAVSGAAGAAAAFRKALGPNLTRIIGFPADNHAAFVCLEADYLMKRLGLGLMKSPVKAVKSHASMMRAGENAYARWWFHPRQDALLVDPQGHAFELRSRGMEVKCSGSVRDDQVAATAAAQQFADSLTEHFEPLAAAIPAFADLWNLGDLAAFAALERQDGLAKQAGVDLSWLSGDDGYALLATPTPKKAETLVGTRKVGDAWAFAVGGVNINGADLVRQREKSTDGALAKQAARPKSAWHETRPNPTPR